MYPRFLGRGSRRSICILSSNSLSHTKPKCLTKLIIAGYYGRRLQLSAKHPVVPPFVGANYLGTFLTDELSDDDDSRNGNPAEGGQTCFHAILIIYTRIYRTNLPRDLQEKRALFGLAQIFPPILRRHLNSPVSVSWESIYSAQWLMKKLDVEGE